MGHPVATVETNIAHVPAASPAKSGFGRCGAVV
jgi:hypothetical protein